MATKDCFSLPLKSKQDIVFGDNSNLHNLNLNRNHQNFSSTAFSEHSKNVTIKNLKVSNSDFAKNDYSKKDSFNFWKNESTKNLPLNFEKENEWNGKISNIKNSTLSLHIKAYENLFEADASEAKKEEVSLNPKNEKQIFNDSIFVFKHPFEFPRQKKSDEEKMMPEISQFKASQRLLNPNQMNRSNYKKPSAQDSGGSSGLTHMTHVSKVPPPARESISLLTVGRLHPQALTGNSVPMAVVALITRNYDPKGDFVPLETVLDDYTTTDTGKMSSASSSSEGSLCCCIHGAPCDCGTSLSSYRSSQSISSNEPEYQSVGYGNAMKKFSNKNAHYPLRSDSYYVKIRSPSSTEKVQIDQNKNIGQPLSKRSTKTRWPLSELTAEMAYSTGNRTSMENLHQPQHAKDDAFYDFYSDFEEEDDTKSLGRRKNKKKKCYHKNDNDEKYPKLESVLEDTGYIELKVSASKESNQRSNGPKSCRRKDKKNPRDYL